MKHNLNLISTLILIGIIILQTSCDKNSGCGECFTPPESIAFRLIDKTDSTDLFYSGIYNPDSTFIYYFKNNEKEPIEFDIYIDSTDQIGIIASFDISWKSAGGQKDFYLELNHLETDTIFLNIESIYENCCTSHPVLEFSINGTELELNSNDWMYYYLK